ncbi:MAG TPA: hypothetical protein VEQ85_08100, partial [Lacipirellulaceae bacterium]|nr:hypothetical protein [Lacipirellulaceae bacterium]
MARHRTVGAQAASGMFAAAPLRGAMALVVALGLAALAADRAVAQAYRELKPAVAEGVAAAMRGKALGILRQASPPSAADLKTVEEYFNGYFFPKMTSTDPEALGQLAEMRKVLFSQFFSGAKTPAAREFLVTLTMKAAGSLAIGPFHPAVRYNAALLIGQLDADAPPAGTPPKPLPAGTNALTVIVAQPEIKGIPVPSSVKIAGLVGLERHTRLGVDEQYAAKITAAALAIASRAEAPADIPGDVNSWMRVLAAKVLANQSAKGATPPVHQALVALVGGKELELDDRCETAKLIVPTMYAANQAGQADEMAVALGKLAKAVLADERTKAEDYQEEVLGGGGGGFGGGGFGDGGGRRGRGGDGGFGRGGFGGMPGQPEGPAFQK